MSAPQSLERPISPPPVSKRRTSATTKGKTNERGEAQTENAARPSLAAIEAGEAKIRNHLDYFSRHFAQTSKPVVPSQPRLGIREFIDLYQRNQHVNGRHFVVHQHNHPVAGVHYDLRLQFSETTTLSFAIPYGLPGNANSKRQGRMAIETRVHNLWNNLIESASLASGSLLIWDTGEYSVLPRHRRAVETDDESSDASRGEHRTSPSQQLPDSEKLIQAFKGRYIRLRLRGARLPHNYTITLRLPANDVTKERPAPSRKRRRRTKSQAPVQETSESEYDDARTSPSPSTLASNDISDAAVANASEVEEDRENASIRTNNAYSGATNSIGSIHQRHWFLTLDRHNSGLVKGEKGEWVPSSSSGFEPFFVRGAEVETSVVTGRSSDDVLADEGVEGFRGRKMWRPVLE